MDELIIRSLQGKTSQSDEAQLAEWLAASSGGDRHYQDIQRIWHLSGMLAESRKEEPAPTVQELLKSGPTESPRPGPQANGSHWLRKVWQIAALLLVGIAIGHFLPGQEDDGPAGLGAAEFVTGDSETVTVTLGDNTVVRLGPESRLRLTGAATAREVWLDGHAYFAVSKQEGQPFRVRTHAGDALVLGTRFDLRAEEGRLQLLVVEGNVELAARGEAVTIRPSEMGQIIGNGQPTRNSVDPEQLRRSLRWMGDFIVFEATSLRVAAHELSLHYGVPIEVLDSTLAQETVHGWFANEELKDVLGILCRAVEAHCSIRESGVTIEP